MKTAKAIRHSSKARKLRAPKAKAKRPALHKTKARKMKMRPAKKLLAKSKRLMANRKRMMAKKPARAAHTSQPRTKAKAAPIPISERGPKKDRMDGRVFTDAREYDRRVYVRFDDASKELVENAAGLKRLSPYIAHFATEAANAGKELVATPSTGQPKSAGVFARFATPQVKKMVASVAAQSGVSLSAYAAHFALEAAKAGRTLGAKEKAAVAS